MQSKTKHRKAIQTIQFNEVEVYYNGFIVGRGLAYYNGLPTMLKPDIVSLTGEILPPNWYTLVPINELKLAVMARNVQ